MSKLLITTGLLAVGYVGLRHWAKGGMVSEKDLTRDLTGTNAIVTGGAGGLAKETVMQLIRQGADVWVASRNSNKTRQALEVMKNELGSPLKDHLHFQELDLASIKSCKNFAKEWNQKPLNLLINSGGIMMLPERKVSEDGLEMQMATNYVGHFVLTKELLPTMVKTALSLPKSDVAKVRIINVSSRAHRAGDIDHEDFMNEKNYTPFKTYGDTKLANIMHANYLASTVIPEALNMSPEEAKHYITANSLHPGVVKTELGRHAFNFHPILMSIFEAVTGVIFKTPWEGAQTSLYLALSDEGGKVSGGYFADCKREDDRPATRRSGLMDKKQQSRDQAEWKKVWDKGEEYYNLA